MTVIKQACISANKCLGKQRFDKEKKYRLFTYTKIVSVDNGVLLYNLMTLELLLLSEATREDIILLNISDELKFLLVEKWFLVSTETDDYKIIDQYIGLLNLFTPKEKSSFLIFPTTKCNARCFYCFEKNRSYNDMSEKTAEDVAQYIISCSKKSNQQISLNWFGGEPFYNAKAIDIITTKLVENKIEFKSCVVTNGYLIDNFSLKKIKEQWKIKKVQITLDGTEEVYNRVKNYIYSKEECASPYKKVINNIKLLIENDVKVAVRLNLGKHNADNLKQLVYELKNHFYGNKNLNIYVSPLFENTAGTDIRTFSEHKKIQNECLLIRNIIKKSGFSRVKKLPKKLDTSGCMAMNDNSVTITPDGRIGKCEHFYETELFGSIYSDEVNMSVINSWKKSRNDNVVCKKCFLYPKCFLPKKCPDYLRECDSFEKSKKDDDLCESILNAYADFI